MTSLLLHSRPVRDWAAGETARLLAEQLGVSATYHVEMRLFPAEIALVDLVVPAIDGGSPALTATRITIVPRVFALLSGRLHAGDIEIESPRGRLVIRKGRVTNLAYRLPNGNQSAGQPMTRAAFASVAITDGRFELDVDGTRVDTGSTDIDVFAEDGPRFEVALRGSEATIERTRPIREPSLPNWQTGTALETPAPPPPAASRMAVDEDVICRVDLRLEAGRGELLLRRLSLLGWADADPLRGTRPRCTAAAATNEGQQVALRVSQLAVARREGKSPTIGGRLFVRAPASLTNRFAKTWPVRGWVGLSGDLRYDGTSRLPEFHGKVRGGGLGFRHYELARDLEVEVDLVRDQIRIPRLAMVFADGKVDVEGVEIAPFAPGGTISAEEVAMADVPFPSLMRDLGVAKNTIVQWDLDRTRCYDLKGTFRPLHIDGKLRARTSNFAVYDRGVHDANKRPMIAVSSATIDGHIGIRKDALEFYDSAAHFGKTAVQVGLVSIGFQNLIRIEVPRSELDLGDITPIAGIPWAGKATLQVEMAGISRSPVLTGDLAIAGFEFGGFPLGDIERSDVRFVPLRVDFTNVSAKKGATRYGASAARLDFDRKGAVIIDAAIQSPHLEVRDFFHMFHFDQDPRFSDINGHGRVDAEVHYDLGGPNDRCGLGDLRVRGQAEVNAASIYGEVFDGGRAAFDLDWADRDASYRGVRLDVPSFTLSKGPGVVIGSLHMTPGANLAGNVVATGLPSSKIQTLGALGALADTRAGAVVELQGSIDHLGFDSEITLSPTRIGTATFPPSHLFVRLEPSRRILRSLGATKCGQPIPTPFDQAEYEQDPSEGTYRTNGELFGGQIRLVNLDLSRQRFKELVGTVEARDLDLGALAQLSTSIAVADARPDGRLTGRLDIERVKLADPARGSARLAITGLEVSRSGIALRMLPGSGPITLSGGTLAVAELSLAASAPGAPTLVFDVGGEVTGLAVSPEVAADIALRPLDLAMVASVVPAVERATGSLRGGFRVSGPFDAPRYAGGFSVKAQEIVAEGLPAPLTDVDVVVAVEPTEIRVERGLARVGTGTVHLAGGVPLRGLTLGDARLEVELRELALAPADGVQSILDADLIATYAAPTKAVPSPLPRLTGDLAIRSFEYSRPITMSADIASLAQRGRRTVVDTYDPDGDFVDFDLRVRSQRPLEISNNLVEASLELPPEGLRVAGSNQRFGASGEVRIARGGRIQLRQHEFEIEDGVVRFEDRSEVAPVVDITAVTEYRRYSQAGNAGASSASGEVASSTVASAGRWLITLHAHGDAEALKIDLSSQPALAQDDIFLLLTVGITRAELDQAKGASVGGSVALEALGTITGADRAVKEAVTVIDDFRFGSAYSSRTGRTEPTVTIGKRLADRIRANVTSGLSDSREVRSNLEWEVGNKVSVEASYDNVNDISTSSLGNLGADVRWRLEFE
ncbi:MAG: translocation/assembly module TamB domain-containing protein [Polyangiaceae bacterium]|nr:translocation/assembly module TamB domain-containing protein [Polyangiaceae bacterium]